MTRTILITMVGATWVLSCGGDGSGQRVDAPGTVADAPGNVVDAADVPDARPGNPADAAMADAADPAVFCADYEAVCGFGTPPDRFLNAAACEAMFSTTCAMRQECMLGELGMVDPNDPNSVDAHCPAATGQTPCAAMLCL